MIRIIVAASVLMLSASAASAQFYPPYYNPYGYLPFIPPAINPFVPYRFVPVYQPWQRTAQFPVIGVLPNGIQVINPWGPRVLPSSFNNVPCYSPGYCGPVGYGGGYPYYQYSNFTANIVGINLPTIQREPGRFVFTGFDTAINPVSGTVLQPQRGVALTNEGAFYRVPGTGTITAYGVYNPGSGVYVNPFTGVVYQPDSGLIIRR